MEKNFLKNVSKCTTLMFKYRRIKRCTNLISVRVAVFRA